jgi:hypothetical protein
MSEITLLDTSVYLNVLDIDGWNQDRVDILEQFKERIQRGDVFLLPLATVVETGNHIADLPNGHARRKYAEKFVGDVRDALEGATPYRATYFPERSEFRAWLEVFPDMAMRNKSVKKTREGVSLADLMIIKEYERTKRLNSMSAVSIWSLDSDLAAYRS